jgi:opacity protein-like surface antigen
VTGQFRGKLSSGLAGGAELQFPLSSRWLALRTDLLYESIADYQHACASPLPGDCAGRTEPSQVVSGSLGVVARLNGSDAHWSPYAVAGVAMYHVGTSNSPLVATMHTNQFGWQGGIGVEVRSSKHVFFVEIRYMTIAPGGVVPAVIGMRF